MQIWVSVASGTVPASSRLHRAHGSDLNQCRTGDAGAPIQKELVAKLLAGGHFILVNDDNVDQPIIAGPEFAKFKELPKRSLKTSDLR